MQIAKAEIMIFLDDDATFVSSDLVAKVVRSFREKPRMGALAFYIRLVDVTGQSFQLPFGKMALRLNPELKDQPHRVSYFVGAGHALRRSATTEVGYYQDDLVWGEEELDLGYRLIKAGYELWYAPEIQVEHKPLPSVLDATKLANELYFHTRNRFFLARKHIPWPNVCFYLTYWMSRYFVRALRTGGVAAFFRGIRDGATRMASLSRQPVRGDALLYLQQNFGRLWR